jgi:hypothetical protein
MKAKPCITPSCTCKKFVSSDTFFRKAICSTCGHHEEIHDSISYAAAQNLQKDQEVNGRPCQSYMCSCIDLKEGNGKCTQCTHRSYFHRAPTMEDKRRLEMLVVAQESHCLENECACEGFIPMSSDLLPNYPSRCERCLHDVRWHRKWKVGDRKYGIIRDKLKAMHCQHENNDHGQKIQLLSLSPANDPQSLQCCRCTGFVLSKLDLLISARDASKLEEALASDMIKKEQWKTLWDSQCDLCTHPFSEHWVKVTELSVGQKASARSTPFSLLHEFNLPNSDACSLFQTLDASQIRIGWVTRTRELELRDVSSSDLTVRSLKCHLGWEKEKGGGKKKIQSITIRQGLIPGSYATVIVEEAESTSCLSLWTAEDYDSRPGNPSSSTETPQEPSTRTLRTRERERERKAAANPNEKEVMDDGPEILKSDKHWIQEGALLVSAFVAAEFLCVQPVETETISNSASASTPCYYYCRNGSFWSLSIRGMDAIPLSGVEQLNAISVVCWQGNICFIGDCNGTLYLCDMHSAESLQEICRSSYGGIRSLEVIEPDLVAFSADDDAIYLMSVQDRNILQRVSGHKSFISAICLDVASRCLISSGWDGCIHLWQYNAATRSLQHIYSHSHSHSHHENSEENDASHPILLAKWLSGGTLLAIVSPPLKEHSLVGQLIRLSPSNIPSLSTSHEKLIQQL